MKQRAKLFTSLTAAVLLPYLLYGFQYFPILDDYIQYWAYPSYPKLSHVYMTIGTLATRPLASLLDPLFWGRFWPCLSVALLLVTALHLLSAFFLHKTLENFEIKVSPFFWLIVLLLPLGMEGRFWLSASTRLVTGLFCAALSFYFLSQFLVQSKKTSSFWLFALFQLVSCGFYEAVAVFSVVSAILLFCLTFYQKREKRFLLIPLTSGLNLSFMFLYYKIFATLGNGSSRAAQAFLLSDLPKKLTELFRQLWEIFSLFYQRNIIGCKNGVFLLCRSGVWGLLVLFCMVLVAWLLCRFGTEEQKPSGRQVFFFETAGLILFLAPLLPNVLPETVWLTNRSLFLSLIGMAFMAEPLLRLLKGRLQKIALFLMAFMMMTATAAEYDIYRRVNGQDGRLLDAVIAQMSPAAKSGKEDVFVVLSEEVITPQNAFYKDHVKSVFDSDWALTGAIRARMQSLAPRRITPIACSQDFNPENGQVIYLDVERYLQEP